MGPEQVVRTALLGVVVASAATALVPGERTAAAAPRRSHAFAPPAALGHTARGERVAVVDLGGLGDGGEPTARIAIATALRAAELAPVDDDGLDEALAGAARDRDERAVDDGLADAAQAFGALDCAGATKAADEVVLRGAARQAAGLTVPALARGWTYLLLCADRAGDVDRAQRAAGQLRGLGTDEAAARALGIDAAVWARYPEVDVGSNREIVAVQIATEVVGAALWIDHHPVAATATSGAGGATSPAVYLPVGEHLIAAASGTRRGAQRLTIAVKPTPVTIEQPDQASRWAEVAAVIAGWRGKVIGPAEIGPLLDRLDVRVVVIRRGDAVEVWGRVGRALAPARLGAELTLRADQPTAVAALVRDRVTAWNDHAPDPDRPLLLDDRTTDRRGEPRDPPTRWYVYASIAGAIVAGGLVIYAHDSAHDIQRVEVHLP
jgi:hypothetical protein